MSERPTTSAVVLLAAACAGSEGALDVEAGALGISIDARGRIVSFADLRTGREYMPDGREAPLLTLRVGERDLSPVSARFSIAWKRRSPTRPAARFRRTRAPGAGSG